MNWKEIKRRIRYYSQYFPFTVNTVFCVAAIWLGYLLFHHADPKKEEETINAFQPFIILMAKMALWLIVGLILVSILSTLATWFYYLLIQAPDKNQLQVEFTTETKNGKKNKLFLNALIEGIRRPMLGFVKGRLFYDDYELTDKFSMLSNKRKENSLKRLAIAGRSQILLPDVKEYQLRGGFIFFEDMLHLFSLAVPQNIAGQFYQPPVLKEDEDFDVAPKKTETLDVRIEEMRRVEGELHNYKSFESGDDVRRIVWKVYAKNRDLVVRTPEMFEPYASHLYFYASFHAAVKAAWLGDDYLKEMLNYYKNNIWTIYDTLAKKEWQMRFIPDQSFNVPEHIDEAAKTARIISNSDWQKEKTLTGYFNHRQGTILCISSLTDPEELAQTLDQCDGSTVVYFVKLSRTFKHFVALGWLQQVVFQPPKDRLNKLRRRWTFAPMRFQVQAREKEIEALLAKSAVVSAIL